MPNKPKTHKPFSVSKPSLKSSETARKAQPHHRLLRTQYSGQTGESMTPKRKRQLTLDALDTLIFCAERVHHKFGTEEDGVPSDWSEWVELTRAVMQAKHALKREKHPYQQRLRK